jgi:hypothetical protein
MADDDLLFEKALARQLGGRGAENGEGASWEATGGLREGCLDAEVLAAYHERALGGAEMILCKEHVASCGRCQGILALLESTEDVTISHEGTGRDALGYEREGIPLLMAARTRRTEALSSAVEEPRAEASREPAVLASVPAKSAAAQAAASASRKRMGRAVAYWVAPLGAIAAGLLVWVGVQTNKKDAQRSAAVETAENRRAAEPTMAQQPEAASSAPAAITDQNATTAKDGGMVANRVAGFRPAARERAESVAAPKPVTPPQAMALDKTVPPPAAPKMGAATQTVEVSAAPAVETAPAASGAKADALKETTQSPVNGRSFSQLSSGMEPQNTQRQAAAAPPAPAPAAPTTANQLAQSSDAATALISVQAETVEIKKNAATHAAAAKVGARLITAPGGNVVWRVGKSGAIEQSRDAGGTWLQQTSGVTTALDGGSAASDAVCWVIGRGGTILVTVDGGGHWTKVASPVAGEIGGVKAADALNATVWDVKRKSTYVTSDGGVSWKRVASE